MTKEILIPKRNLFKVRASSDVALALKKKSIFLKAFSKAFKSHEITPERRTDSLINGICLVVQATERHSPERQ